MGLDRGAPLPKIRPRCGGQRGNTCGTINYRRFSPLIVVYSPFIVDKTRIDGDLCGCASLVVEEGCTEAVYASFPIDKNTIRATAIHNQQPQDTMPKRKPHKIDKDVFCSASR